MAAASYISSLKESINSASSTAGLHLASGWAVVDYPRGAYLCLEGSPAEGVFRLVEGQAKECFSSATGKTAMVRVARPGDLIGLEAVLGSGIYGTTVQTLKPTRACFITRRDLLGLLRGDEKFRKEVVEQLGDRCKDAYADIRRFALTDSVSARVAQFLLGWKEAIPGPENGRAIRMSLTHEEIGQLICSSRETVSRTLTRFRREGWIRVNGARWIIQDRQALTALT